MRRWMSYRVVVAGIVVAVLATTASFALATGGARGTNHLTTVTTSIGVSVYPTKDLPPSRDNDAGRARSLDVTPDNDTDAWQRG